MESVVFDVSPFRLYDRSRLLFAYRVSRQISIDIPRYFLQDFGRPTSEGLRCILNEKATRLLGFYNDADVTSPVGRTLRRRGGEMEVVGVVRDFHHGSLYRPIYPVMLISGDIHYRYLNVRIAPYGIAETIDFLDATVATVRAGQAMNRRS